LTITNVRGHATEFEVEVCPNGFNTFLAVCTIRGTLKVYGLPAYKAAEPSFRFTSLHVWLITNQFESDTLVPEVILIAILFYILTFLFSCTLKAPSTIQEVSVVVCLFAGLKPGVPTLMSCLYNSYTEQARELDEAAVISDGIEIKVCQYVMVPYPTSAT
jgi:hypothetical protein